MWSTRCCVRCRGMQKDNMLQKHNQKGVELQVGKTKKGQNPNNLVKFSLQAMDRRGTLSGSQGIKH